MNLHDLVVFCEKYKPFLVALSIWSWVVTIVLLVVEGPSFMVFLGAGFGFVALFGWTVFRDW